MATIEERAVHLMNTLPCGEPKSLVYNAYKMGATEQKAIDDKEKEELINLASKRIADVEASRSRLLQRRESIINEVIDKAKRAFCKAKECVPYEECHRANGGCFAMQRFIEAMEE